MPSSYVNNLRLEEMATGEKSGTWGTITNTNLELIGEALGYGTEAIATDADTTITMQDATSDGVRALYLKITSGVSLTATRTVTLAPNTVSKVWIIENATTGSQSITIAQGSGGTVTIANGTTKIVSTDGAGAGAAVTDVTANFAISNVTITGGSISGITDLAVADGGTGASDAGTARTNLGLGSIATQNSNSVTITGGSISGITDLAVADGGTGASSLTANNVILGNGTSAVQFVAPGTSGNVLTSNGTTWTSGAAAAFDSGTLMVFQQTAAPTGWTKQTTHDNKAFRVVSGTASSGGSVAFSTAFASQTPTGSVSISSVTGSAGATTLSTPQIPSHNHSINVFGAAPTGTVNISATTPAANPGTVPTNNTGGGGSHTHPFSFSSGSGTFSGNAINLAVQYVDLIIASKN